MEVLDDILGAIGETPLVRLSRLHPPGNLVAKIEYLNPGGSIKDRIALPMITKAELEGRLAPGGTIVEPTSGNTGVGLAIAARLRGYRLICVMADKQSQEKRDLLRAYGAEVVVCPTDVPPDHPDSYYSVAQRLAEETPGGYRPNQYTNPANPQAHYDATGPELWRQTDGELRHLVVGVGTGGTISGMARYIKEQDPTVTVVGVDPVGSIFTAESADDVKSYLTEGVGEDFWPATFDRNSVDRWEVVSDAEAISMTRRLATDEGVLVGGSCGLATVGALRVAAETDDLVAVVLPDGGRSYLSKIFNDDWIREHGFDG
jgi:cystathionine beta-synthase